MLVGFIVSVNTFYSCLCIFYLIYIYCYISDTQCFTIIIVQFLRYRVFLLKFALKERKYVRSHLFFLLLPGKECLVVWYKKAHVIVLFV